MEYAKDSLGRSTGRRFNMAGIKRALKAKDAALAKQNRARERRQEKEHAERLANPINIFK